MPFTAAASLVEEQGPRMGGLQLACVVWTQELWLIGSRALAQYLCTQT